MQEIFLSILDALVLGELEAVLVRDLGDGVGVEVRGVEGVRARVRAEDALFLHDGHLAVGGDGLGVELVEELERAAAVEHGLGVVQLDQGELGELERARVERGEVVDVGQAAGVRVGQVLKVVPELEDLRREGAARRE